MLAIIVLRNIDYHDDDDDDNNDETSTLKDLWPPEIYDYKSADNQIIIINPPVIIIIIIAIIIPGCGDKDDSSV